MHQAIDEEKVFDGLHVFLCEWRTIYSLIPTAPIHIRDHPDISVRIPQGLSYEGASITSVLARMGKTGWFKIGRLIPDPERPGWPEFEKLLTFVIADKNWPRSPTSVFKPGM